MELILMLIGVFSVFGIMAIAVWIWERMGYRKVEKYQAKMYRLFMRRRRDKCRKYIDDFEKSYK